ncbi:hypothetical protein GTY53_32590 [Streptomyces sp. SID7805]|nr:hypothetical protein [Streptomyces sp. SID7805]
MHTYDASSRAPYPPPIPGMRPPHDPGAHTGLGSATPIYDALYAEYRRSFRALPGDRTDEPPGPELLGGHRDWARTTASSGHWEVVARQPYPFRGHVPAALPPGPRDSRLHGR